MSDEVDEFLAHHGIKGMRWGVHKERTSADIQKNIRQVERKRNSLSRRVTPASLIVAGAGARSGTAKKVLKLKEVKDANGGKRLVPTAKTPKVTDLNRAFYDKKINRRTYAKYIGTGALVVSSFLLASYGAKSIKDPEIARLASKGALILAGAQAVTTAGVVVGVHRNIQDEALSRRQKALQKELKSLKSTQTK